MHEAGKDKKENDEKEQLYGSNHQILHFKPLVEKLTVILTIIK